MPGEMQQLYGYGRLIRSQIAIPGAVPADLYPDRRDSPALEVHLREPRKPAAASAPSCSPREGGLDYGIPGLGSFSCAGRRLVITPEPSADMAHLQAVVVATMLPTLLWQADSIVLHAAAVAMPDTGRIVAISGPSGSGKSTIAAGLVQHGARLVADDSLSLAEAGGRVLAHGLPGGQYRVTEGQAGRIFRPLDASAMAWGGELAAVVVIESNPGRKAPQRLPAIDAAQVLLANRHRPQVPDLLGRSAAVLRSIAQVASAVPVYRWQRAAGAGRDSASDIEYLGTLS